MKTQTKQKTKMTPTPGGERGPLMRGCEILVAALEREGVDTIFAYPGGASMEVHQVLTRSKQIRTVLPRHEQGGAFAASGYARATGKVGVCMATSGPGATNLITGIADAYMDSVPLVAITGQVPTHLIGRNAFQETDMFGLTLPIVKHNYLVTDVNDLARIVKEAFYIASTGRPGPVVIDLPKDIQQAKTQPIFPYEVSLRGYDPNPKATELELNEIIGLLETSERPLLLVGGGIIAANAANELREFVELTGVPVVTTIKGIGAFPETHPLSLKWLGMHGTPYANWAVNGELVRKGDKIVQLAPGADLLLTIGMRFNDRVTGDVKKFCEHGTIVHVDVDVSELNKNKRVHLAIHSDAKYFLSRLNALLKKRPLGKKYHAWHQQIAAWKEKAPLKYSVSPDALKSKYLHALVGGNLNEVIQPQYVIEQIYKMTEGKAIIATGVGQHQMWTAQYYKFTEPRQFISSCGLGAMGFGLPAAIGAKVGRPDKIVIDIDGDGSFLMNIQELATAHIEKIPVKVVVLNNQHLGMVVQWEDRFYGGNRGHTYIGDPKHPEKVYPDFLTLAEGFGVKAERVARKSELEAALERLLTADEPYVLDVVVPYTEHVLPFIPPGKTVADMMYEK